LSGFLLELLNGNWGIAATSLATICAIYLIHETAARGLPSRHWRKKMTMGMRVAIAMMVLSIGVAVRSGEVYLWRVASGDLDKLNMMWLIIGGTIALLGFLCCIREISKPLYGVWPWAWTLVVMAIFTAFSVINRFFI
jgi:uncharacterized membrane protein YgdD (TMEM256/DUF423 family)